MATLSTFLSGTAVQPRGARAASARPLRVAVTARHEGENSPGAYKWTLNTDKGWCMSHEQQCKVAFPIMLWKREVVVGMDPKQTDVILKEATRVKARHAVFLQEGDNDEKLFVKEFGNFWESSGLAVDGKKSLVGAKVELKHNSTISFSDDDVVFTVDRTYDRHVDGKAYIEDTA